MNHHCSYHFEEDIIWNYEIPDTFFHWLRSHVLDILATKKFISVSILFDQSRKSQVIVKCLSEDRESVDSYIQNDFDRLWHPAKATFGTDFAISTRIFDYIEEYAPGQPVDGALCDYYVLNDGNRHPTRGFGTYKVGFIPASASGQNGVAAVLDQDVKGIIKQALDAGFRMFDCAQYYGNEAQIGEALSCCGLPREELYIVSKVWSSTIEEGPLAVKAQVLQSLKDLQIGYFDLYLIHWPVPTKHVQAYHMLEQLQQEGLIKSIGVSNYSIQDFEELMASSRVIPAVNQFEVNPFMFRSNTIKYFQNHGCLVQGYRCLANGKLTHPLLKTFADKYQVPVSAIMVRFLLQQGIVFIGKSANEIRIRENFCAQAHQFKLSDDELDQLRKLTSSTSIEDQLALYKKCVIRDTSISEKYVKQNVTFD